MTSKSLMLSGADAMERLMTSYKEILELAGYASRVANIFKVFEEVSNGIYVRDGCVEGGGELKMGAVNVKELKFFRISRNVVCFSGRVAENNDGIIELSNIQIATPTGSQLKFVGKKE